MNFLNNLTNAEGLLIFISYIALKHIINSVLYHYNKDDLGGFL